MVPQSGQVMLAPQVVKGTKAVVSQQQSIETVQVMMYSSISMLCHMRKTFHPSAYEGAEFAEDDEHYTFDSLLKSDSPPRSPSSVTTTQSERNVLLVPLLKRNKSKRVDLCLDMLESVFEALSRKSLHSFRLGFVSNPHTTRDLVELYTFRIRYKSQASMEREIEGVQLRAGDDVPPQDIDIQGCLLGVLGNLYDLFESRSPLPGDRHLTGTIRYVDDGWDPRDFTESPQTVYSLADLQGWQQKAYNLGSVDSGFQEVGLNVIFLENERSAKRHLSSDLKLVNMNAASETMPVVSSNEHRRGKALSPEPQRTKNAGSLDLRHSDRAQSSALDLEASQRSVVSATQVAEDKRVKEALHDMMQPSLEAGDMFATQQRTDNSQIVDDQNTHATALAEHMNLYAFLSRDKARQIWCDQDKLRADAGGLAGGSSQLITCQCQKQQIPSVDEMVQCSVCKVQQHVVCQGYVDDDPRRPPLHICCNCLIYNEAAKHETMKMLKDLALRRQVVHILLAETVTSEVELAEMLGISITSQAALVDQLVSEGYLVRLAKRQTRSSQGKVELKACAGSPDYLVKVVHLFDPRRIVDQHFSTFTTTDAMLSEVHRVLVSRYPALAQDVSTVKKVPQAQKRALTDMVESRSEEASQAASVSKRSRTSMAGEQMATPRRSSRTSKVVTPKFKESTFDFLINGTSLPSRGNSATKSIRLRED